jgi:hypothetical protein
MDEQKRMARELEAPEEIIAAELERLRILKEHERGAWVEEVEGEPYVRTTER